MCRNETCYLIWMKFWRMVHVRDWINCANFGDDRLSCLWWWGVKFCPSLLTLIVVLTTRSHYRASVCYLFVCLLTYFIYLWRIETRVPDSESSAKRKSVFHVSVSDNGMTATSVQGSFIRSTSPNRPNKVGLKCPSVHFSVCIQKVSSVSMKFDM